MDIYFYIFHFALIMLNWGTQLSYVYLYLYIYLYIKSYFVYTYRPCKSVCTSAELMQCFWFKHIHLVIRKSQLGLAAVRPCPAGN